MSIDSSGLIFYVLFVAVVAIVGDSAKALAVSGLAVVGRDKYGVFPLKGKMLNVREASASQMMANSEVTALKQILGLQSGKKYTSTKELRYGRVMIMADQDHVAYIFIHHNEDSALCNVIAFNHICFYFLYFFVFMCCVSCCCCFRMDHT